MPNSRNLIRYNQSKIDLSAIINESNDICDTAGALNKLLQGKLKPCTTKATYNTCDAKPDTKEEYFEIPWKNYVKKKLIQGLLDDLHNICLDNQRRITEVANTHKLKEIIRDRKFLERQASQTESSIVRYKKQVIAAIMVGIVTSLISKFTSFQLFGMSQTEQDHEALINNQNHIISILAEHETILTGDEKDIKRLEHHLTNLEKEMEGIVKQDTILVEATAATNFARAFNAHFAEIQRGLFSLFKNKLDPSVIGLSKMEEAISAAALLANKKGFTIALNSPVDIYQVEKNFVSDRRNNFILIHTPLLKSDKIVDIYRYIETPMILANSIRHIAVEPDSSIIAINSDRSLCSTFSLSDISRCNKLHNLFWCPAEQVQRRAAKKSCTFSLYMQRMDEIEDQCQLRSIPATVVE